MAGTRVSQSHPKYKAGDLVKIPMSAGGETEHIWVEITKVHPTLGYFTGKLDNDPVVVNKQRGDTVRARLSSIEEVYADNPAMSFAKIAKEIRAMGMEVKRTDVEGEYHVNFPGGKEGTAYYTEDGEDAVSTARAMIEAISNPGASAISMAETFHGRPYRETVDVVEEETYPGELAELGKLISLEVIPHDNSKVVVPIIFSRAKDKQVILAADGAGENLHIVGGEQEISAKGLREFGVELNGKGKLSLGQLHAISYFADKHHLEGPKQQQSGMEYYHVFCDPKERDEDGERPEVVYDVRNKKVELVGGTYKVEDVGIKG